MDQSFGPDPFKTTIRTRGGPQAIDYGKEVWQKMEQDIERMGNGQ